MKDLIEEKNKKEKMKQSVIKFWNVSYGEPEPVGTSDPGQEEQIEHILQEKEEQLQQLIEQEKK